MAESASVRGPSTVLIWHRMGPYHLARARALSKLLPLTILEMSGRDLRYAWDPISASGEEFNWVRVFDDCDCDEAAPREVSRRLHSALDSVRPEVVIVPSWGVNYANAALLWCIRNDVTRVVFTDSAVTDKERSWALEAVKKALVGCYQSGIVGGGRHTEYLRALGMPGDRIFSGYNCVDNAHFARPSDATDETDAQLRRQLNLPERYILTTVRFIPEKNLPFLLRAFARFAEKEGPTADSLHLVILGDGAGRTELEDLRGSLGLEDRVHLPGFKQYPDLPAYYRLAESFILSSVSETWGLVVNEAMAAGLPVLVSANCNCAPLLVRDGVNGFVFSPYDVEVLTNLLLRMAALPSPERNEMSRMSREIVAEYSTEAFAKNAAAAVRLAVDKPRRANLAARLLLPALTRRTNSRAS